MVETTQRPGVILFSERRQKLLVHVIELTVPWETQFQKAHERKFDKYENLMLECREAGWQT